MKSVQISSLELKNFRQFLNQKIDCSVQKGKNMIVIEGKNQSSTWGDRELISEDEADLDIILRFRTIKTHIAATDTFSISASTFPFKGVRIQMKIQDDDKTVDENIMKAMLLTGLKL